MNKADRNRREKLLREISIHSFAAYELMLFLDTHPDNREALAKRREHIKILDELKEEYEVKYGPITADNVMSKNRWTWIDDPWPWNNEEDD
jgi:spore coat protein JB